MVNPKKLAYDKQYYRDNIERLTAYKAEKIECECGCFIARSTISVHRKSLKHNKYVGSLVMGRPSANLSEKEKKAKALRYSMLYRQKQFNIKYNITFRCELCNKDIIIDPVRPHEHWKINKCLETIVFD